MRFDRASVEQLKAWGAAAHDAPPIVAEEQCEVWDVNAQSAELFLACETQWRTVAETVASGGASFTTVRLAGIDYVAADVAIRRLGLPDAAFRDLRVMEGEALEAMAERR